MTNEELNAWAILIAVLLHKDDEEISLETIKDDIPDIKKKIQTLE